MSRNYGLPYKGSKNRIAEQIVAILPPAHTLYDLFCGGCAITDCAMEKGKYQRYVINDIDPRLPNAFRDALAGKFKEERRVIDRTTFHLLKDTDPYVSLCWSFGNNTRTYIWADDIAQIKLPACKMVLANTMQERRFYYRQFINSLITVNQNRPLGYTDKLLESMERLERLQNLENLERLQSLESCTCDYQQIEIACDSVIYCDIPYRGTEKYNGGGRNL